jgi:hypothetical protein
MPTNTSALFRQLRGPIADILLREWDPIGVAGIPEAQGEYDGYVPQLFARLASGATPDEIATYLMAVETETMGLNSQPAAARLQVGRRLLALALEEGLWPGPYPCPSCGFLVFTRPPGSYDVCRLCNWEDDAVQLSHPALGGGANVESLVESQRRASSHLRSDVQILKGIRRDSRWRPLSDSEAEAALATLRPGGHLPPIAEAFNDGLYYWL